MLCLMLSQYVVHLYTVLTYIFIHTKHRFHNGDIVKKPYKLNIMHNVETFANFQFHLKPNIVGISVFTAQATVPYSPAGAARPYCKA